MAKTKLTDLENKFLTHHKRWYWKDPEKARRLQREKYKRYPDKIKAMNKAWQEKNKEHWNMLMKFAYAIKKAKLARDTKQESLMRAAREEYKKSRRRKENNNGSK